MVALHNVPIAAWGYSNATIPLAGIPDADPSERTTLHLKNLPVNYTREMLLSLFDNHGFQGQYDFVYLPIDASTQQSYGVALVNLIDCVVAAKFWDTFQGFSRWWHAWCKDVCEVSWSTVQGFQPNIELYRKNTAMHEAVPDEFKPAIFINGVRSQFPLPAATPEQTDEPAQISRDDDSESAHASCPSSKEMPEMCTTVMLKNLPTNYTREMLCRLFDNKGFAGQYDFVLLPMDFKTSENRGSAHVNFVDSIVAAQFWDTFQGFCQWWHAWCKEVLEVSWSPVQGFEAQIERYRNSPLMHESVPDAFKPVIFASGVRCDFPPPTEKVRPPRTRRRLQRGAKETEA
jgi:hypothetical protein